MSSTFVYKTHTPPTFLKKCCFCLSVKQGSYFIGYILTILKVISTGWAYYKIVIARSEMEDHPEIVTFALRFANIINYCMAGVYFLQMISSLGLIVGLHKNNWEKVMMFYHSFTVVLSFEIVVSLVNMTVLGYTFNAETWLMLIPHFVLILAEIYFIFIVRRCSQEMRVEAIKNQGAVLPTLLY